jgi:PAS domain S-box-containing protein
MMANKPNYKDLEQRIEKLETKAEQELKTTSTLLDATLNAIPDVIGIQARNHIIIRYNEAGYRFLNISPEEARGKRCYEIINRTKRCEVCATSKCYKSKKPERIEKFVESMGIWLDCRAYPILDEAGNVVNVIEHLRDITERKHKEVKLRESEERFRCFLESSIDACSLWDSNLNLIEVNNVGMSMFPEGTNKSDVIGKNILALDPSLKDTGRYDKYLKVIKTGIPLAIENVAVSSSWGDKILDVRFFKVGNGAGMVVRDITGRIKTEEALKKSEENLYQAQKLEGIARLGSGIAHDLNNILTAIIGNTELAIRGLEKRTNIRENLDQVLLGGKKASDLVSKILTFSRKQVIYPEVLDVNETILNLSKILHRVISEDIKIVMNLDDKISPVKADPTQIEQILINLVVNARDAIKQKKKLASKKYITIETSKIFLHEEDIMSSHIGCAIGTHILLSVTDTGIGIDKEIKNRIFEPFFTTKKKGEGTGLGLSTVYGIVKQNNGSISIYSEPGDGTTVKIYWPAFEDEVKPEDTAKEKKIEGGNETILFVEDDDKVRKSSVELLKLHGYKVFSALNGKLAFEMVNDKDINVDLLITDVVMPEMGGVELAKKMKYMFPQLEVLYCSGYPDNHIVSANGILSEDINFISKPYSSMELSSKIREILDKD